MSKKVNVAVKEMVFLSIDDLTPFQGKLKTLSDDNYEKLKNEIIGHDFSFAIHIWKNDNKHLILDGHQRLETLKRMKDEGFEIPKIPVAIVEAKSLKEAKLKVLSGTSQYGEITKDGFMDFVQTNDLVFDDFANLNFPEINIDNLKLVLFPDEAKDAIEDEVPEVPKETFVKPGDMFQLGEHRLLCADCTVKENVERLMGTEKADMVFTDPPYGINVLGSDNQIGAGKCPKKYSHIEGDLKEYNPLFCINYAPLSFIWGGNYFAHLLPKSTSWIVWNKHSDISKERANDFSDCELAWTNFNKTSVRLFTHAWIGFLRHGNKKDECEKRLHPTQKPVGLFEEIFKEYEFPNKILDLFGGSGSTLIACEKTNRKCFMSEISPEYVEVIINRWEKYSGKKAVKL